MSSCLDRVVRVVLADGFETWSLSCKNISSSKVVQDRGAGMKFRDAIRILMESPLYFRLPLPERLKLVKGYCQAMNSPRQTQ
ncbi:MAG: hypothetical protein D3905_07610 [Candidatus Electrothrix sp. AS4_5]|nr:hypothetical protein [Candidatus Electrothrix gigas]